MTLCLGSMSRSWDVDRKARALLFLGFAVINFVYFRTPGMHALGILFFVFAIYLLVTKPKLT
jgi:hypothetical protein